MLAVGRNAVDQVEVVTHDIGEHLGDFFRRVLQVVIHGDDVGAAGLLQAAHEGIVLPIVAHQLHSDDVLGIALAQGLQTVPRSITAAVIDQQNFVALAHAAQHGAQARMQLDQGGRRVINRDDNRNVEFWLAIIRARRRLRPGRWCCQLIHDEFSKGVDG